MMETRSVPLSGKRAVLVRPGTPLQLADFEVPAPPPGGMVIEVTMAGVCGSDWHIVDGHYPPEPFPMAMGHEGVGVVKSLGEGVTTDAAGRSLAVGDRVFWSPYVKCGHCQACTRHRDAYPCEREVWPPRADVASSAAFQQFATLYPANEVYRIADDTPTEAVIAFGCAMVAVLGGFDKLGEIRAGHTVVIQGSGPVGLAATILAALSQADQVIVIGDPIPRLAAAERLGANTVLSLSETTAETRAATIRALTEGRGADVVIEASGNVAAFDEGMALLTFNGRYLNIGLWAGSGTVALDPFRLNNLSLRIIGSLGLAVGTHLRVLRLIEAHHARLDLSSLVTHRFPLHQLAEAIDTARQASAIKVVVTPNG
jgi:threonine dehydrogenase-like Zn-dependent dehydrogenase